MDEKIDGERQGGWRARLGIVLALFALVGLLLEVAVDWRPGIEFGIILVASLAVAVSPVFARLSTGSVVAVLVLYGGLLIGQFAARGHEFFPLVRWNMYGGRIETDYVRSFVLIGTTESGVRYRIVPHRLVPPLNRTRLNAVLHRDVWAISDQRATEPQRESFVEMADFLLDRYNAGSPDDPLRFLDFYTSETRLDDFLSGAEMRNFVLRVRAER